MVSAKWVQTRPETMIIAALAKWHQTLSRPSRVPWTNPLTIALKLATADLATVMAPTLGRASADPYQAVSKRLLELHSNGGYGFPSETAAEDLQALVRECGIATASFGVLTRQDRALKYLESRLAPLIKCAEVKGRKGAEEDKRHLIWQAMDEKIYSGKRTYRHTS